jgi:hypothetical protein
MAYTPHLTPNLVPFGSTKRFTIIWEAYIYCGDPCDSWYNRKYIKCIDSTGGYYKKGLWRYVAEYKLTSSTLLGLVLFE